MLHLKVLPLVFVLSIPCFLVSGIASAENAQRPNVIFILVDDLRFDGLGATGHSFIETPNIDRIASEGMRFNNAFVTTPLCSPSRGSFYSGQYARTHKYLNNVGDEYNTASDATLQTWVRSLQRAGYRTAHVGKWHMDPTSAPRHGYDHWVGFKGQGDHSDISLNVNGTPITTIGYTTDILMNYAIDFIREDHGGKPFALTLAFKAVHGPFPDDDSNVPSPLRNLYEDEPILRPPSAQADYDLEGKPILLRTSWRPGITGPSDDLIQNQLRMTTHIDQNIGRLLDSLEASRQLDNTLIIFTSDNGYFWGEHGLSDKRFAYDEAIRIPLLMRLPERIKAGTSSDALALSVDIGPTLLELAGVNIPDTMQGASLVPVMQDPTAKVRDSFLAEYFQEVKTPDHPTWTAIRTMRWKFITYPNLDSSYDELYDLVKDTHEMNNLVNDAGASVTLAQMKAQLALLEKQLRRKTKQLVVSGHALDIAITEAGTEASPGESIHVGSSKVDPAGGRNALFVFELPTLDTGDSIDRASFSYRIDNSSVKANDPAVHADLWVLGIGDNKRPLDYLEADIDSNPEHVKIGEDMLWWDRAKSFAALDPDAAKLLAVQLMKFYRAHPNYVEGSYLYLRLNPDDDIGISNAGWDVMAAESPISEFRPKLLLTYQQRKKAFPWEYFLLLMNQSSRD